MASILVIEDEPGVAEIMTVNLVTAGHDVVSVKDGNSALEMLAEDPPDLVLLDLNLPQVSGFRVITVMRRTPEWQDVPVVVVTAYNFEEAMDVVRSGVDEFLTKPFDVQDLLEIVGRVLGKRAPGGVEDRMGSSYECDPHS